MENPTDTGEIGKAQPLGDGIFRRILNKIYDGDLCSGDVINESALAAEFGVSRGPVREAVRRLQGVQIVTREPYMKARVVDLNPAAMLDLFQMREALEGYSCRLATQRMSDEDLAALAEALDGVRVGAGTAEVFDFHVRVAQGCGNARIIEALCGDLYHLFRIYRRRSSEAPERKLAAAEEHWQIMRAMQARDALLAESLMRAHIARAALHLTDALPGRQRASASHAEHHRK